MFAQESKVWTYCLYTFRSETYPGFENVGIYVLNLSTNLLPPRSNDYSY